MNGITELAKLLKERENSTEYTPMFGTIIELPEIKIRINEKVILNNSHLKCCINLLTQNSDGDYIYLGREVVLLPFANTQKFIVIGVVNFTLRRLLKGKHCYQEIFIVLIVAVT